MQGKKQGMFRALATALVGLLIFNVPATQESGASQLVVIVNGIPSAPVAVWVN